MSKYIRVLVIRSIPGYGYFKGDAGQIASDKVPALMKEGYISPLPDDENDKNPLPEDLPARDLLFENGFESLEQITKADKTLTDIDGIGGGTLKKIKDWIEKQ